MLYGSCILIPSKGPRPVWQLYVFRPIPGRPGVPVASLLGGIP